MTERGRSSSVVSASHNSLAGNCTGCQVPVGCQWGSHPRALANDWRPGDAIPAVPAFPPCSHLQLPCRPGLCKHISPRYLPVITPASRQRLASISRTQMLGWPLVPETPTRVALPLIHPPSHSLCLLRRRRLLISQRGHDTDRQHSLTTLFSRSQCRPPPPRTGRSGTRYKPPAPGLAMYRGKSLPGTSWRVGTS